MRSRCLLLLAMAFVPACVSMPPIQNNTDLTKVDFSEVKNFKRGESCTTFLFGIIPFGSTRITSAARDARIKSLKVVEYETRNYVVITQFCLVAYGI